MPSYCSVSSKIKTSSSSNDANGDDDNNNNDQNNNNQRSSSAMLRKSSTAPLSTSKKKQHQHLLMVQLRNAIYETYQAPPDGATEEMVLERRSQLEELLKNLEAQYQQSKNEALEAYNNRWLKSMTDQLKREKSTQDKIDRNQHASERQQTDYSNMKHAIVHDKNFKRDERIVEAAKYLTSKKKETMRTVLKSVKKQDERYQMMQERKEEEARMWKQRQMEAEKHCEEMLQRKMERDEEHRREKEEKANERRRAAEDRLDALRARKAQEAKDRSNRARETYRKGNVVKIAVDLRGKEPKMINVEVPYEERLRRQEEAERQRDEQVKTRKKELWEHWQGTVGARHRKNLEYQQARRDEQLKNHDQRCTQLQSSIRRQNQEAAERKRQLDAEHLLRTQMKEEEISMHRQRHADTVHNFQDDAKKRVFDRWNRQLVQVSAELGIALPENFSTELPSSSSQQNQKQNYRSTTSSNSNTPQPGGAKFLPGVNRSSRNNYETNDDGTFLTQQRGGGTPARLGNFVG